MTYCIMIQYKSIPHVPEIGSGPAPFSRSVFSKMELVFLE
jgi:hypothetical protein